MEKQALATELEKSVAEFTNYILALDRLGFERKPEGKWSAGQQLEHLIRAINPLVTVFRFPHFVIQVLFGKSNRESRSYASLLELYKERLQNGGVASRPYIPPIVGIHQKDELVIKYLHKKDRLLDSLTQFSEADLDQMMLPHPLLGKLTIREMLYFTIFHNIHHLNQLHRRETDSENFS